LFESLTDDEIKQLIQLALDRKPKESRLLFLKEFFQKEAVERYKNNRD